jgi:hypothetical protein
MPSTRTARCRGRPGAGSIQPAAEPYYRMPFRPSWPRPRITGPTPHKPDRSRALELLAGCGAHGCTDALNPTSDSLLHLAHLRSGYRLIEPSRKANSCPYQRHRLSEGNVRSPRRASPACGRFAFQ